MKKRILMLTLAALLAVSPVCFAYPATDKVAHFGTGYILQDQLKRHTKLTYLERLGCVALVAYAKEKSDTRFDWRDFGATIAGAMAFEIKW